MALVNRDKVGTSVSKELKAKLVQLSKKTRIDQSKLLDEALEDLFKKYESQAK